MQTDLIESLLRAIVREDGDALIMHVGEPPVVVSTTGQVEVSSQPMTFEGMSSLLERLVPLESRRTLDDLGAVELELPAPDDVGDERFTVVAACGGADIWIELRRHRRASNDLETVPPEAGLAAAPASSGFPSATVLPLTRPAVRPDLPGRLASAARFAGLERLLRLAAARGASALYLVAETPPSVRVDGEIRALEGEHALGAADIESLILGLVPNRQAEAPRGASAEWIADVPEVGRVQCLQFRDHRGIGAIFRMIPARPVSADQLGLSREIRQLAAESEGLVLVTGPRSSGKSMLLSAFVDLINQTRGDHVITVETQIAYVHVSRRALVSQREVRGDLVAATRAALREDPDVLVIEDLRPPEVLATALDAAASGHLVIGAVTAPTATAAIDRLLDRCPPEERPRVQTALARTLRGVVAQVLLRKVGGGQVGARELLLNTGAITSLIAEGRTSQLPLAIESGRKLGLVPLNDALVGFVQSGAVDVREAYRQAFDRAGLLGLLRREGIDTSFVERLA